MRFDTTTGWPALTFAAAVGLLSVAQPVAARAELIVVLDPGHGGTNAGGKGVAQGSVEKRLCLALARRTAAHLQQIYPGAKILLTRDRDEYLTLDERVRRANGARATLFASLHFNASESHAEEGFETFILSREASDREADRLTSVENGTRSGATASTGPTAVDAILGDLRQVAAHASSARLASAIQKALRKIRGARRDRGVRQAAFDVLLGLRMPAVLIEAGFLDHSVEGPDLVEAATLETLAVAVAAGIVDFLEERSDRPGRAAARRRSPPRTPRAH